MNTPDLRDVAKPPRTVLAKLLGRAEEWIYEANAQDHPMFRLYDAGNALWARIAFSGVRRRASLFRAELRGRDGARAVMRWLAPSDEDALVRLWGEFDFRFLPPHALDRKTAARVLTSPHCLALGVDDEEGRLVGYSLIRLFFPRRAVMGLWLLRKVHTQGFGNAAAFATTLLTRAEGLPNFVTIPRENLPSLATVLSCGWRLLRTNRGFHVLVHDGSTGPAPGTIAAVLPPAVRGSAASA
ncbi:MAG TPA: hypothetical protein VNF72_03215 [Myxococcota bacterium]|nr:hypothetical protein [Myxococcota bacterium]